MPIGTNGSNRFYATAAAEAFDGLANFDFVYYTSSTAALTIDLTTPSNNTGIAAGDTFVSIEYYTLGRGNDEFVGSALKEQVSGYFGNDTLSGAGGDDLVSGHAGDDTAHGGSGNDGVWGGGGNDTLNGDANDDLVVGDKGNDSVAGGAGNDTVRGGTGNDSLNGGAGSDILTGGAGTDAINVGVANDDIVDYVRFGATAEFGDTVTNFDVNGTLDLVQFGGGLRSAYDDGSTDGAIHFAQGNNGVGIGSSNVTVGQGNTDREGLLLRTNDGVSFANLDSASAVATAFNAEFNITAANGEDAILVVNATSGNGFSVWQWIQVGGGETAAGELELIGVFTSNNSVTTASFGFY